MDKFRVAFRELTAFVLATSIFVLVDSQDQSGFISIDCGSSAIYTDSTTGLRYVPDTDYINSGENKNVAPKYYKKFVKRIDTVRSFPEGIRNCYRLKPLQAGVGKFLIRALFMHGSYDLSSDYLPEFDLYIGVNFWSTVSISDPYYSFTKEIIHTTTGNFIDVCLVNKGQGTPFITSLELRPMANKDIYSSTTGSLSLYYRGNLGTDTNNEYRYGPYCYDIYDRVWNSNNWNAETKSIVTTENVTPNLYYQPSEVMKTAVTPINPLKPLEFSINYVNPEVGFYFYLHFAEIQTLAKDESREFNVYLNDSLYNGKPIVLKPALSAYTLYNSNPITAKGTLNFSLRMTDNSTLPPILNAFEAYTLVYMSQLETDREDVLAINNLKSAYNVSKIWQGDPCGPQHYSWDGLSCSFSEKEPRIISLNLSSSNLKGEISAYIYDLKLLQKLDLSNNSLVGGVPEFLSKMTSLTYINLKGNNLNGTVPADLVAKSDKGSLTLILDDNPKLCSSSPCNASPPPPNGKKSSLLIPIAASIIGVIFFVVVVLILVLCKVKRKKSQGIVNTNAQTSEAAPVVLVTETMPRNVVSVEEPVNRSIAAQNERIQTRNKCFTASEVSNMTNNYSKVIGKGGFGTVYLGFKDGVKVAVKILSASSTQGYKEFKAEAELLMTVHHRNLTSLIGYCDDGNTFGLVYEFMANGNLGSHISDRSQEYLSWEDRLHIAVDSAQGLEYLHNGCRDPIVHRDIKPANILLNEKYEAKIADFGLSRAFSADTSRTGVLQTVVAGTAGYLDPEYYQTQKLNEKSDVFSFGIVLLEIITSRPVLSNPPERIHISVWVSQVLSNQGDIKAILDPRLRGDYDTNSAWQAVEVAMTCVSPTSVKRPSMSQVVSELSQCLNMEKARKGFTTDTMDSVEMVSFGANNSYTPSAR